ncbi:hypothetical protein CR513_19268, partial [Mucuna pruriens]
MGEVVVGKVRTRLEGRKALIRGVKSPLAERHLHPSLHLYCLMLEKVTVFDYPNRHVMIVKEDRDIKSGSFAGGVSTSSDFENLRDESHYEGDLLVVKRLMNAKCLILGNLCFVIINGGSCVNVVSERLVKKLTLPTIVHPRPEKGEVLVDKQIEVAFTLGAYKDRVVCDVVLIEATHLLLGKP